MSYIHTLIKNEIQIRFLDKKIVDKIVELYLPISTMDVEKNVHKFYLENSDIVNNFCVYDDYYEIGFKNKQIVHINKGLKININTQFESNDFNIVVNVSYINPGEFKYTVYNKIFNHEFPIDMFGKIRQKLSKYFKMQKINEFKIGINIYPTIMDDYPEIMKDLNNKGKNIKVCLICNSFESKVIEINKAKEFFRTQGILFMMSDEL